MKTGADMGHIFLIGMMGCGKSAVGRSLAHKLFLPFIDLDSRIEKEQGKAINDIFAEGGEVLFRELETAALINAARNATDSVISCGGGIILSDENVNVMRETGKIVWIYRDIERIISTIDTKKRPLLSEGAERVRGIFESRKERYEDSCHIRISNHDTIDGAAERIISALKAG
ncbi:shikimate kinase [Christensenella intestinihominis]|uniref:shikimate kinase n=1 Tax=Christensenella intestinihominis TaxID=1851429 RepID=UPI0009F40861|nr:shikimate kinase [Christensenella intestinihominis]